jgi:hypothetical protein
LHANENRYDKEVIKEKERMDNVRQLQRERYRLQQQSPLQGCWLASYLPRGTARTDKAYYQLRSRGLLPNGKHTQHIPHALVPLYQQRIAAGRALKAVER